MYSKNRNNLQKLDISVQSNRDDMKYNDDIKPSISQLLLDTPLDDGTDKADEIYAIRNVIDDTDDVNSITSTLINENAEIPDSECLDVDEIVNDGLKTVHGSSTIIVDNISELESAKESLKSEMARLQYMMNLIKTSYENEKQVVEDSYEIQKDIVKIYGNHLERLIRQEHDALLKCYETELENHRNDRNSVLEAHMRDLTYLRDEYERNLNEIRTGYKEEIDLLQKKHHDILENAKFDLFSQKDQVIDDGNNEVSGKNMFGNIDRLEDRIEELINEKEQQHTLLENANFDLLSQKDQVIDDGNIEVSVKNMFGNIDRLEDRIEELINEKEQQDTLLESTRDENKVLKEENKSLKHEIEKLINKSKEENWLYHEKCNLLQSQKSLFEQEMEHGRRTLKSEECRLDTIRTDLKFKKRRQCIQLASERKQLFIDRVHFNAEIKLCTSSATEMKTKAANEELTKLYNMATEANNNLNIERQEIENIKAAVQTEVKTLKEKEYALAQKEDKVLKVLSEIGEREFVLKNLHNECRSMLLKIDHISNELFEYEMILKERIEQANRYESYITAEREILRELSNKLCCEECSVFMNDNRNIFQRKRTSFEDFNDYQNVPSTSHIGEVITNIQQIMSSSDIIKALEERMN